MRPGRVFENSECRRLFTAFAVLAAIFICIAAFAGFISNSVMSSSLTHRESAIAGKIIRKYKINDNQVAQIFAERPANEDYKTGNAAFESAGYTSKTANYIFDFLPGTIASCIIFFILTATLSILICSLLVYVTFAKIYGKIDIAAQTALCIGVGKFDVRLDENDEGALARLAHAFNEMSSGVRAGFEKLGHERGFFKNLISDISHQLKTPLSALKMYNEIILQEPVTENVRSFTEKSGEQLERMEWLILGLLKMARVEADCMELNLKPAPALAIAEQAAENFTEAARKKNIKIIVEGEGNEIILCDFGWLREAVGNVLKNCIEYTPDGGCVTVAVEETPVMVNIKVSDTGPGISEQDLPHIFKRFYRGRASKGSGSGIGLSLAKSITDQMGGALLAGSNGGHGAVFTFSFLKKVM